MSSGSRFFSWPRAGCSVSESDAREWYEQAQRDLRDAYFWGHCSEKERQREERQIEFIMDGFAWKRGAAQGLPAGFPTNPAQSQGLPASSLAKIAAAQTQAQLSTKLLGQFIAAVNQSLPLPTETSFGEISAFRCWRVTAQGLLQSTYKGDLWLPGQLQQAAGPPSDSGPLGLHGWKSLVETISYGESCQRYWQEQRVVYNLAFDRLEYKDEETPVPAVAIGRVKLWGEVVEHQRGYRAQFASIVGIDDVVQPEQQVPPCGSVRPWSEQAIHELQIRYGFRRPPQVQSPNPK